MLFQPKQQDEIRNIGSFSFIPVERNIDFRCKPTMNSPTSFLALTSNTKLPWEMPVNEILESVLQSDYRSLSPNSL